MSIVISNKEAQDYLSNILVGCSINKVSYYITGWDLRLISDNGTEYSIYASDIKVPNIDQWLNSIIQPPVNINDTNELEDTITAIIIFTVINKWPINKIQIDSQGNLYMEFGNGSSVNLLAVVEHVDWTWKITTESNKNIVLCDSGVLYKNAAELCVK